MQQLNPGHLPTTWEVAVVVMIGLIILAIIFRGPLTEFLRQAQFTIHLRLFGILDVDVTPLRQAQERMVDAGIAQRPVDIDAIDTASTGADLSAHEAVIQQWARLNQIVNDAASSREIQLTPGSELPDVLSRLISVNLISGQLASAIRLLYEAGKEIAKYPGTRLDRQYARVYEWLTEKLIAWIRRNIIAQPPVVKKPPPPPLPRRTQVGGYFPTPGVGAAAVILVGIKGPVRGKQFRMEKELFRIGADPANDLVLTNDDYVSAKHALIRYDKGSLVLADQHSWNGTFLNENRLKDIALTLTPGDRIRVGSSTFEVVQVPGR